MKYRIRRTRKHSGARRRDLPLRARRSLHRTTVHPDDPIDFGRLFEISDLPDLPPEVPPRFARLRAFGRRLREALVRIRAKLRAFFGAFVRRMRRRAAARAGRKTNTPIFAGAFCATLLVSIVCAIAVILSLVSPYGGSYTTVTVPSLVGTRYDPDAADTRFSYVIHYEYNPEVASGHVISQSPPAGVTRRVYGKNGHCLLTLSVSRDRERYTLPSLVGLSRRDAVLELRRNRIPYVLHEQYADGVDAGRVLLVSPEVGTPLDENTPVTLVVSLGAQVLYAAVPSLVGVSEQHALSMLASANLVCGTVSYTPSSEPIGTVLSQDPPSGARLPVGSAVDLTVSAGAAVYHKTVPSLYGLSRDEAVLRLREYGLVLGDVVFVGQASSRATVVNQSPAPGTPITSAIVAVDIHLGT